MRILLTGAHGMVGRNFLAHACAAEHDILAPSRAHLDLSSFSAIDQCMQSFRPDIVVHAAGHVGGIQANMREPVLFLLNNLDIGRNVVCAAFRNEIPRVLNLGSSCMYPRDFGGPLHEEDILKGALEPTNEGYALAKIVVARLCDYIAREQEGFYYKTLVPCNLYGEYDKFDPVTSHMVPSIIRKIHLAKNSRDCAVEIWGDGSARREFMYVGDLAECMWRAVQNMDSLPQLMNVGLGMDWTVNEYYEAAAEVIGYEGAFKHDLSKPVGMKRKLVCTNLCEKWGWSPKTTLREGLTKTYEFYLKEYCQ